MIEADGRQITDPKEIKRILQEEKKLDNENWVHS